MGVAICVAMDSEAAPFRELAVTCSAETVVGQARFQRLTFAKGTEALLVISGIGLVNAAVAASTAVQQFGADILVSSGSAGGVGSGVKVGDVVIGNEATHSFADATAFGEYVVGQIPRMPPTYLSKTPLAGVATGLEAEMKIHRGPAISGDAFVSAHNFDAVTKNFPTALAADMETAAIAQVAHLFGIHWLAVRGISDLCGPAAADDFVTHVDDAAARAAAVVIALLGAKVSN
ncbi:MAG: 5'-methylthioadenosine/S-adenosylhomocysteine nucleosidase [Cellulomonadaceae bacterium]|jgi:adenosylhomocysteine nucleosidase|nr:5'-methylthioadenosine/S-adenosylhomocysteine nucleosidase [Cellulomonadaceae bacterium]